jgi:hypothetical protein
MSSDSKVDARHADGDDEFENLPAVDEKNREEEELKEPEVYNVETMLPPPKTVVCVNWVAVIVLGIAVFAVYEIRALQTTPVATVSELPFRYHRIELVSMTALTLLIAVIALASVSLAVWNHRDVTTALHAHRMETYRLHKELRATRAKKD